jgi:hypothetical protein
MDILKTQWMDGNPARKQTLTRERLQLTNHF